ncbi:hypothetical protein ACHAW6_008423 [Cyclotella cf. meneghiniana]
MKTTTRTLPCIETSSSSLVHQHDRDNDDDDDDDDNNDDDDDDPLNENYIALLHYRSPRHILQLPAASPASPAEIQRAYSTCREETLNALRLIETKQQQGGGGGRTNHAFFMSQLNYLELKLRALDQAVHLLLPHGMPEGGTKEEDLDGCHQKDGGGGGKQKTSSTEEHDKNPRITNTNTAAKINNRTPNDSDKLETIHVHLRPQTITVRSALRTSWSSESRHSLDMSSVSWDVSRHAFESIDDDDDDGLMQVLGPMNSENYKNGPKKKNHVSTQSRRETNMRHEDSPRSIVDFSSRHGFCALSNSGKIHSSSKNDSRNNNNIKNDSNRQSQRQKPPQPSPEILSTTTIPTTTPNAQCTIEAARKGVLRALSEDDSECLPFEEDYDESPIETIHHNKNASLSASLWVKRINDESHAHHHHHYRGDDDEDDEDWIMKCVNAESNRSVSSKKSASSQRGHSKRRNVTSSSRESYRSCSSHGGGEEEELDVDEQYRMLKTLVPATAVDNNNNSHHPTRTHDKNADSYDTLLQSGMALAADICTAVLGVCWEGTASSSASAKVGFVGKGEHPSNESYFSYFVNKEENGAEEDEEVDEEEDESSAFRVALSECSARESKYREKKMLV